MARCEIRVYRHAKSAFVAKMMHYSHAAKDCGRAIAEAPAPRMLERLCRQRHERPDLPNTHRHMCAHRTRGYKLCPELPVLGSGWMAVQRSTMPVDLQAGHAIQ